MQHTKTYISINTKTVNYSRVDQTCKICDVNATRCGGYLSGTTSALGKTGVGGIITEALEDVPTKGATLVTCCANNNGAWNAAFGSVGLGPIM